MCYFCYTCVCHIAVYVFVRVCQICLYPHACSDADVPQRQKLIQKLTWSGAHGQSMCCCCRPSELASNNSPLILCVFVVAKSTVGVLFV